jgi:hypothetical protein
MTGAAMKRVFPFACAAALLFVPRAARAQESNFVPVPGASVQASPGWVLTPGVAVGTGWDDNVLVRGGDNLTPGDVLNTIAPRATLTFNGRRTTLATNYDGAFLMYRELNELDSYDQRASFYLHHLVKKHLAFFVRNTTAFVPTTELAEFIAVPFVRTGSHLEDVRSGIEAGLTKFTTLSASYDFQMVDFNQEAPGASNLQDGHSHGASLTVRHMLDAHLAMTADYQYQHAALRENQQFDIQNGWFGVDYQVSEPMHVYAAGGISRLFVTLSQTNRTGPAWRLGLARSLSTASIDVHYSRSFVPSYGFGGTMQNEEATARVRFPIGRRVSASTAVSWRRDDPLTIGELPLRSYWVEGSIGYAATPWVRIEGFYAGTQQTIQRAGGSLDRNRAGVQVVTARPMRIR